jgi:hypothetical protein
MAIARRDAGQRSKFCPGSGFTVAQPEWDAEERTGPGSGGKPL